MNSRRLKKIKHADPKAITTSVVAAPRPKKPSVYWEKTLMPEYTLWSRWQSDISLAPRDETIFMGTQRGTNKAFAVKFNGEHFVRPGETKAVDICQWISFTDYADIRHCVWNSQQSTRSCYE
jgi:hypothetical protein